MYYGPHKISETRDIENDKVLLLFEPEKDEEGNTTSVKPVVTSKKIYEHLATEEATDRTDLQTRRTTYIVGDLMAVLMMHNLYGQEYSYIIQDLERFVQDVFNSADEALWGVKPHEKSLHLAQTLQAQAEKEKEEEA